MKRDHRAPDEVQRSEAAAWDEEYISGRYEGEPELAFVSDIINEARASHLIGCQGLYIGCGNGRNYLPLVAAGLDLVGIDISRIAIDQLAARLPERRDRLVHGPIGSLTDGTLYPIVIGIQVFQHGDERRAHEHMRAAQARLAPGGLFCIRVNANTTDLEFEHDVVERNPSGGYTVKYLAGPKSGLHIHFFALAELLKLFEGYEAILAPRLSTTWRKPPAIGQWSQWEAIFRERSTNLSR